MIRTDIVRLLTPPRGKTVRLAAAGLTLAIGAASTVVANDRATVTHSFDDVEKWVERFENPERETWQRPGKLLGALAIEPGQTLVDLGAGTGYISIFLSAAVGDLGKVYAVDVEPNLVKYMEERDFPYDNVEAVLADPDDPKLPEGVADIILVVNTWHHIDKRRKYLEKLTPALKPGGRIAVIDWLKEPTAIGPPVNHRLDRDKVISELTRGGFTLVHDSVMLPYQYFLVFVQDEFAEPTPFPLTLEANN